MKQTAALALGILGLKMVFVQLNEIMNLIKIAVFICQKNSFPIFLKGLLRI